MATPVIGRPTAAELRRLRSAKPVSGDHGRRWANDINFLLAAMAQPVVSCRTLGGGFSESDVEFFYARSAATQVLRVVIELESAAGGQASIKVELPDGAEYLEPGSLDGLSTVTVARDALSAYGTYECLVDVTGLAPGSVELFAVICTPVDGAIGIYRVHVTEVSLPTVDPSGDPTNERGINASWPLPPSGRLHDAGVVDGDGFGRLFAELDLARNGVLQHWQIIVGDAMTTGEGGAYTASTSFASIFNAGTHACKFWMRARRPFRTTDGYQRTFVVRYQTSSGSVGGEIQLVIDGTPAGTISCPASTSWATASTNVVIPTTDDVVELEIQGRLPGGNGSTDVLRCRAAALIENGD